MLLNRWVIEDGADMKHPMGVKMDLVGLSNWEAEVQSAAVRHHPHKVLYALDMTIYVD